MLCNYKMLFVCDVKCFKAVRNCFDYYLCYALSRFDYR